VKISPQLCYKFRSAYNGEEILLIGQDFTELSSSFRVHFGTRGTYVGLSRKVRDASANRRQFCRFLFSALRCELWTEPALSA